MSQNSKLFNLTTKANIKQCKYISKTAKKKKTYYLFIPEHDIDIYSNNICKNKKLFQVKYSYKFKL